MKTFNFKVKIEPATRGLSLMCIEVQEPRPGIFCRSCDCGKHYMAVTQHNTKFNSLREWVGHGCKDAMRESRIDRPLVGTIVVEMVVQHKRPQNHYGANGDLLQSHVDEDPHCWPALLKVAEGISEGLQGIAFHKEEQINGYIMKKQYGDDHQISVTVSQVSHYDLDARCKQPNLFDLDF